MILSLDTKKRLQTSLMMGTIAGSSYLIIFLLLTLNHDEDVHNQDYTVDERTQILTGVNRLFLFLLIYSGFLKLLTYKASIPYYSIFFLTIIIISVESYFISVKSIFGGILFLSIVVSFLNFFLINKKNWNKITIFLILLCSALIYNFFN